MGPTACFIYPIGGIECKTSSNDFSGRIKTLINNLLPKLLGFALWRWGGEKCCLGCWDQGGHWWAYGLDTLIFMRVDLGQPEYTVVDTHDGVEFRQYEPFVIASVLPDQSGESGLSNGFRRLAGYILAEIIKMRAWP